MLLLVPRSFIDPADSLLSTSFSTSIVHLRKSEVRPPFPNQLIVRVENSSLHLVPELILSVVGSPARTLAGGGGGGGRN